MKTNPDQPKNNDLKSLKKKLNTFKKNVHKEIQVANKSLFSNGLHIDFEKFSVVRKRYCNNRETIWIRLKEDMFISRKLDIDERIKIYVINGAIFHNTKNKGYLPSSSLKLEENEEFDIKISKQSFLIMDFKNITFEDLFIDPIE